VRELICERCGAAFTCGHSSPRCWCRAQVAALPGLQKALGRDYDDCLCQGCLNTLVSAFADVNDEPT
jgi:hypothetical protein